MLNRHLMMTRILTKQKRPGQYPIPHSATEVMPGFASLQNTMNKYLAALTIALLLPLLTPAAHAAQHQPAEPLRQSAKTFLSQQLASTMESDVEITIGGLDRRLRLTVCKQPPKAFLPAGTKLQGKLTVGLRCAGPKPWTVYIPAQIKIYTEVMAATRTLSRNTKVTAADVITVRQEVSRLHSGYFINKDNVVGKILKRSMTAGQTFTPSRLKTPLLVRRGDEVTIIASKGGLQVRVKGKALKNAAKGEQIPVRNNRSKRVVQAIAVKSGTVSVRM